MSLLLVVSLLSHAFGPLDGLPRKDGFAAICTGDEIVYIPLSSLGLEPPRDEEPAPKSDQCPWFAQFHAMAADPAADGRDAAYFSRVRFVAVAADFDGSLSLKTSLARGPPDLPV
ncbi:hypothetical protein [Nisaea sp.]|uniref:hypothetical protein n=1 Tax=Nisaea sp. TaxID=2024842 RepID=UPI003B51F3CC